MNAGVQRMTIYCGSGYWAQWSRLSDNQLRYQCEKTRPQSSSLCVAAVTNKALRAPCKGASSSRVQVSHAYDMHARCMRLLYFTLVILRVRTCYIACGCCGTLGQMQYLSDIPLQGASCEVSIYCKLQYTLL